MTCILDISAGVTCLLHMLDFMCILGLGLVATCLRWVLTSGWDSMVGSSTSTSVVSNGWRDLAPLCSLPAPVGSAPQREVQVEQSRKHS